MSVSPIAFGNIMAAIAFALWGIMPLYYQFLPNAAMDELLALRIIASVPVCLLIIFCIRRKWPDWQAIWADKASLGYAFVGSCLMSISWYAFTWALTNGRVMEASLGFFIGPLVMIALGVVFMKETLSIGKRIGVALAVVGLSYQVWQYGELPIVALVMATFFALYGLCKKHIKFDSYTSLLMESLLVAPFAIAYIAYKHVTVGSEALTVGTAELLLYLGAAPVTLLPLVFYSYAVRYTSMTMVGLMQYIEPSLQFILAVALFGEIFDEVKAVSFGLIWIGLAVTLAESVLLSRKRRADVTPR
ncbi:EamA family transporter RarD [Vibrio paucivorans]